jgi:ATP-binding cassette subfamily B protein
MFRATTYSILNRLFDLAPPILIGAAVDIVVKQKDSLLAKMGIPDVQTQLMVLAIATVVIWGLESVFEYLFARAWRNLAQTIQHELRLDVYQHIQKLEMEYFEDRSTGGLMAVLNDDINQLERFLDIGANDLIQVGTTVLVVGGAFLLISPTIALWTFLPMPFILWGTFAFQKRIAGRYASVREKVSSLNGQLANNLTGIETIKSFTTEEYEAAQVCRESQSYVDSNEHAIALSALFVPLIRMVIVVGFVATLLLGGLYVQKGLMEVGSYSVLIFLTQRLLWPLTRLGNTFDMYQRAMASTDRALDLLDTPIQVRDGDTSLEKVEGEIRFENVDFGYKDRELLFEKLNLHFPTGQTIAIVGSTGSGKSSIVRLLLRFYDVNDGRICLDGHDIRDLQIQDLRQAIGLVSQSVFLFHGSVRDNIAYGRLDASIEEIQEAARAAEAHDFIMSLPQGYDTLIGERGQKLSGGQRQRLSIARAVLKNPPILILDEATSAVDNETEAAIQRSMAQISKDRTTLVIAHRLSTIRHAHQILVMAHGKVEEQGTHQQLVELDGVYARLWRVQTGEKV